MDSNKNLVDNWQCTDFNAVGFDSTWKIQRTSKENEAQTNPLNYNENWVQVVQQSSVQVQTEEEEEENDIKKEFGEPYPPSLYAFFAKVTDPICELLEENLDPFYTQAFKQFLALSTEDEETDESNNAKKLFTLKNEKVSSEEFEGSCVCWSKNGGQIAVGYESNEHDGWCNHSVPVSVWNINRREIDEKKPHIEVMMNSCISAMDFHPSETSILAVGLHSGHIAIVNLTLAESPSLDPIANAEGTGHILRVTCLKWISWPTLPTINPKSANPRKRKTDLSKYCILTGGADGFICLWRSNKTYTRVFLERKFIAWSQNLGKDIKIGNKDLAGMKEIGITALSTCKDDQSTVIFSTFGGFIFMGNLQSELEIDSKELNLEDKTADEVLGKQLIINPITSLLQNEGGFISSTECSLFIRNLIINLTNDGHISLINIIEPTVPVLEIYLEKIKCSDLKWSNRPMMFAAAEGNCLCLFDLSVDKAKPILKLSHEEIIKKISFNRSTDNLIAICDVEGFIVIWKLSENISAQKSGEYDSLIELSNNSISSIKE